MYTKLIEQYEDLGYNEGAQLIADTLNLKMEIKGMEFKDHWKEGIGRYVFKICLKRDGKQYTFNFGQSIAAGSQEPAMYDVLTCLQKYDVEDFDYFCDSFGFDNDSRKAYKTYKAVVKEFEAMQRLFNADELDLLSVIN